jgi:DNA-binding beta-propeller fold protein YncE
MDLLLVVQCVTSAAAGVIPPTSVSSITTTTTTTTTSEYEADPTWKPDAPAALNVSGVSAVATCAEEVGCTEVYVAQRGGVTPIIVLDRKTGKFLRAFGRNSTSNASLTTHVHGLSWSVHHNVSLWATDAGWMNPHKLLGFDAEIGQMVTAFGVQGTGTHPLEFGNIADTSFASNGTTLFVADGDMGINNRVSRLDHTVQGGDRWTTTWCRGNNATSGANTNFSAPHSVAYDESGGMVYVADRDNRRVVALEASSGTYKNQLDLRQLLGPHYYEPCPTSNVSCLRVWSVRISGGQLFVGMGSWASPAAPGYIAVLDLNVRSNTRLRTVIEIGRRFPHEIAVDAANGFVYSAAIDLIDHAVAPGIGALTRYRRKQ